MVRSAWILASVAAIVAPPSVGDSQIVASPDPLQQRVRVFQEVAAQNEQQLRQYQWIETTTITSNGMSGPAERSLCRYTPNESVSKAPLGVQPQPPALSGGPIMRRIESKKIAQEEQEVAAVKGLTALYLPISQVMLGQTLAIRRVDIEPSPTGGDALIINDYVKPGDKLILGLDTAMLRLRQVSVQSYFAASSDVMSIAIEFSVLGDGTTYASVTTVNAPQRGISITTVSSDFSKPVQ